MTDLPDTPEARHLAKLTAELRGITDQLKVDFTPEALARLTPHQRAALRSELTRLRHISSRVAFEIGEHVNAMLKREDIAEETRR